MLVWVNLFWFTNTLSSIVIMEDSNWRESMKIFFFLWDRRPGRLKLVDYILRHNLLYKFTRDISYHKAFRLNNLQKQLFYSPPSSAIHVQGHVITVSTTQGQGVILITGIHQGPWIHFAAGFGTQSRRKVLEVVYQKISHPKLRVGFFQSREGKRLQSYRRTLVGAQVLLLSVYLPS